MGEKVELPVISDGRRGLGRREVLQGLVAAGAGLALPALADDHPVRVHLADHARVAAAEAKAASATPAFLDAQQLETFASLAERIVPGATTAGVAPFVDQLLAVDTQDNQRKFVSALGGLEGEAIARYGHPWNGLTPAQQVELLTAASTTAPAHEPRSWRPGQPVIAPAEPDRAPTLRDRFDHLKGWVVGAYVSSEAGMRELGWTGQMFFPSFPGCEHPGGHR